MLPATTTAPRPGVGGGMRFFTFARQVPLGAGQTLGFQSGRGYFARPAAPGPSARPAAPTGPGASPGLGSQPTPALTDAQQAQQQVSAIVNPLIASIQAAESARAQQGQQLIGGYTTAAENALKGIDFGAPDLQAAQSQNAINTALLANLKGQGGSLQDQLAGALNGIGAPSSATQGLGQMAANDVTGAAGAGLASGDAVLSELMQNRAANQDYGMKLPGLEALAGFQDSGKLQGQVANDEASKLDSLQGQIPGMVQSALSSMATSRYNNERLAQTDKQNTAANRLKQQSNLTSEKKIKIALLIAQGRIGEAEKVASENNQTRVSIANANNATRASIADANNSTRSSIAQGRNQTSIQTAAIRAAASAKKSTASGAKPLTRHEILTFLNGAATTKRVPQLDANGNTELDANGKVKYATQTEFKLPYEQAYQQLLNGGISDQAARQALNTVYPKGQGGRSWLTNEEQHALAAMKQPQATGVIDINNVGERHYVTVGQAKALRSQKMLPPGFWYKADQGHTVYVIRPGY